MHYQFVTHCEIFAYDIISSELKTMETLFQEYNEDRLPLDGLELRTHGDINK